MSETEIRVQRTPNPNAMKFSVGRPVLQGSGSRTVASPEAAQGDPIAQPLFALGGVQSVFMVADFVTVIKTLDADWDQLVPRVVSSLQEVFR